MPVSTKEKNTTVIEEELRKERAQGQPPMKPKRSVTNTALGIVEIAAGLGVIIFSFTAGVLLSAFLGAVVLLSGIFEIVNGAIQRSGAHLAIGILGAIAGVYILANPLASLSVIGTLIGVYLVIAGVISAYRARQTASNMTGGIIEALIGLLVLFGGFSVSFLLGMYLIVLGIMTYSSKPKISRAGGV